MHLTRDHILETYSDLDSVLDTLCDPLLNSFPLWSVPGIFLVIVSEIFNGVSEI